ncbi:hypothetical protein [Streptomyces sp. NPDC007205]|uniref:hypothetical protein n=1 Tax=Streptomyces sp. NPDC007205 TaxID=3154316 RepID=UPI0033F10C1E
MRSVLAKASVAVIAIGSLAACGGGSGTAKTAGGDKKPSAHASAPAPLRKLAVPAGYDTSRGWQLSRKQLGSYVVLPKSGAVATVTSEGSSDGAAYRVTVRDAVTGRVRWTGKPFKNLSEGEAPHVFVATAAGKEYLVTWSQGVKGEDTLSKAKNAYALDIYAADGSGDAVAPAHHVGLPATEFDTEVTDGGERVLVPVADKRRVAVDVATGRTTTYDTASVEPPACPACTDDIGNDIAALTEHDPVVANKGAGAFGIPGSWNDDRIAPADVDPATGEVWPGTGGHLLARWSQKNFGNHHVWAVLDSRTGQVQASVLCAKPPAPTADAPHSALSPNGRYLVSEHLAFDLKSRKGYCFEETDDSKPLSFVSVTDDGTAYGTSLTNGNTLTQTTAPVQLSLATGTPKALPGGSEVPIADFDGVGVFAHDEGNVPYLVVYRHKS